MLKTISARMNDFSANYFMNELFEASKLLGVLEAKIDDYKFSSILIPMFQNDALNALYERKIPYVNQSTAPSSIKLLIASSLNRSYRSSISQNNFLLQKGRLDVIFTMDWQTDTIIRKCLLE